MVVEEDSCHIQVPVDSIDASEMQITKRSNAVCTKPCNICATFAQIVSNSWASCIVFT